MIEYVYYNIPLNQIIILDASMSTLIDIADGSSSMIKLGKL